MFLMLITTVAFVSCTKEEQKSETLAGTKWIGEWGLNSHRTVQFTSNKDFFEFISGNSPSYGTYTINGNNVVFTSHSESSFYGKFKRGILKQNKTVMDIYYNDSPYPFTVIKQ